MYSPLLGRFLSEDPIGFDGSPDGNFFAYCGNDPVNFSDPLGLHGVQFGGTLIGSGDPDLVFDAQGLADGLDTGLHGAASGVTFGLYDGGAYRCTTGFGVSQGLGKVGGAALALASAGAALESEAGVALYCRGQAALYSWGARAAAGSGAGAAFARFLGYGGNCFPAGTMVQLADGSTKRIEDITDKDVVWARDDSTGETKACHIKRTFHKEAKELVVLSFGEVGDTSGKIVETVRCTVEHPFFVSGRGWVGAKDLGIGTEIVTRAGPNLVVRKVDREAHPGGVGIYNFEVEGLHSYFVGEVNGGVWVHNLSGIEEAEELGPIPSAYDEALAARDAMSFPRSQRPAAWTAIETGEVATGFSRRGDVGGLCAEDSVVASLGGDGSKVFFTPAMCIRQGILQ